MNQNNVISDEKLNALLDNELDSEEKALILTAMKSDSVLAGRFEELKKVKKSIPVAYSNPPLPTFQIKAAKSYKVKPLTLTAASFALLILGSVIGWLAGIKMSDNSPQIIYSARQLLLSELPSDKLLIHISSMNKNHVESALNSAELLLQSSKKNHTPLQLEVVVNSEGIEVLRQGSPYAAIIEKMTVEHRNISFKACGVAKKIAALKEGRDFKLLPQAEDIPAALDQILTRMQQGWAYVKG